MAVEGYPDRFWNSVVSLGRRFVEESGVQDIMDEVADFTDPDMSVADYVKNAGSLIWQTTNAPLNTAAYMAIEANRAAGAAVINKIDTAQRAAADPLGTIVPDLSNPSSYGMASGEAWHNYMNGWIPPEELPEGAIAMDEGYTPLTLGGLAVVGADRFNQILPIPAAGRMLLGIPYGLGTIGQPAGPYTNGSYVGDAYDIRNIDAGEQIRNSYLRTSQMISDLIVEATIDPLNKLAPMIGAGIKGRSVRTLVATGGEANSKLVVPSEIVKEAETARLVFRAGRDKPGIGLLSQSGLARALAADGELRKLAEWVADPIRTDTEIGDMFYRSGFIAKDGAVLGGNEAAIMGKLGKMVEGRPDGVYHLLNAAAFKNVESIDALKWYLRDNTPAINALDTLFGTGDNILHRTLADFADGTILPDGHDLQLSAKRFLDDALADNPEALKAWDELAEEARADVVRDFGRRAEGNIVLNRAFGDPNDASVLLQAVPAPGRGLDRAIKRAGPEWLAANTTTAKLLPGGLHRFKPSFLLLSKPGLTFKLHGTDAIRRYDDMIRYANDLIGTGRGRTVNRLAADYQFATDPEVIRLRQAFVDAGTVSKNPEQIRARLVDELQKHVLTKIAEESGFEYEIAEMLADAGMMRGDGLFNALTSKSKGYMTAMIEDGVPQVLVGHPSTEKQSANFVPIMDWAGVRKAMQSSPMKALTDPDSIASVASDPTFQNLVERYPINSRADLRKFGRMETVVGKAAHSMIDIGDAVLRFFKKSVLLRLGYGVRNIGEGMLATTGSGVGLLEVMGKMDVSTLAGNTLSNWGNWGERNAARVKTFFGMMNDTPAIEAAARQVELNLGVNSDGIAQALFAVTNGDSQRQLVRLWADPTTSEPLRQKAMDTLTYLTEQRIKLTSQLDAGQRAAGLADSADEAIGVGQRLYYADLSGGMTVADDAFDPESVYRIADGVVDRPLATTPFDAVAQGNVDAYGTVNPFADGVAEGPQWATRRFSGSTNSAPAQFNEAQVRLKELRAEGYAIEWRQNGNSPWTRYTGHGKGQRTKYIPGESENWQFRAVPKAGRPKVLSVETWGAEVDLRATEGVDALMDRFTDLDKDIVEAARAGDRAAQVRVSNILSDHGAYRVVFPDTDQWGGVSVLVHPKGVGERGFSRAVAADINTRVTEAAKAATPDMSVIPTPNKRQNQLPRGAKIGSAVNPHHYPDAGRVLKEGGFEKVVDELIAERVQLLRQRAALQMQWSKLRATGTKVAKKRGIGSQPLRATSRYSATGETPVLPGVLEGADGYAFRNYASADQTTGQTISANLYRSDRVNDLRLSAFEQKVFYPADPDYFDGFANLLGRYYRDLPGAEDYAKITGLTTLDDVDPIVLRALAEGDRERLLEDAVDWALNTSEGREWVRTLDLATPTSGKADDAITAGRAEAAYRGTGEEASRKARRTKEPEEVDWRQSASRKRFSGSLRDELHRVEVEDVIETQFKFVDEFLLTNPEVKRLFLAGEATSENLRAAHNANPWELKTFSGAYSPTSAESKQARLIAMRERGKMHEISNMISDAMDTGLRKIGSAPETRLLRHPVFVRTAEMDFQQRVAHAEAMYDRPLNLTELNGLRHKSQEYALTQIKETLYTLESRSSADDYLRFVSPFFPAWLNAASRWGKFYMRNPAMPGKIASRITTVMNNSLIVDENGAQVEPGSDTGFNTYLVVPFGVGNIPGIEGIVNKIWPGAADVMNQTYIPLRSLDVVFQGDVGDPGFGPFVTVPTQWILTHRDEWAQDGLGKFVAEKVMPVGPAATGTPAMDYAYQFLPSGAKRIVSGILEDQSWYASYTRNLMVLQSQANAGEYTGTPEQMNDDAMKLTKFMQAVKVMSSFVAPMAQQQRGDFEHYAGIYREMRDAYEGSSIDADEAFYQKYPAQFILTQGSTTNLTGGMATAQTTANQGNWGEIERLAATLEGPELLAFTDNYQEGGTLAAYDSEEYNPFSRRWQMYNQPTGFGDNYRGRKTAEDVVRDSMEEEGWMKYSEAEAALEAQLVAAGLRPGSGEFLSQKEQTMAQVGQAIAEDYPLWDFARKQINTGRNERNALFFRSVVSDPEWVSGKEDDLVVQSITEYLNTRDFVRNGMEQQGDAKQSDAQSNARWNAMLALKRERLAYQSPSFREWVDRYFRNDIISVDDTTSLEDSA